MWRVTPISAALCAATDVCQRRRPLLAIRNIFSMCVLKLCVSWSVMHALWTQLAARGVPLGAHFRAFGARVGHRHHLPTANSRANPLTARHRVRPEQSVREFAAE